MGAFLAVLLVVSFNLSWWWLLAAVAAQLCHHYLRDAADRELKSEMIATREELREQARRLENLEAQLNNFEREAVERLKTIEFHAESLRGPGSFRDDEWRA
jgi:uncharacterized protein YlxW (UPF0749 family)